MDSNHSINNKDLFDALSKDPEFAWSVHLFKYLKLVFRRYGVH